jgi:hypothetical protein
MEVYPRYLTIWFAIGLIAFVIGVIILCVSVFVSEAFLNMIGAVSMAFGSIIVTITVYRGQYIDEHKQDEPR